MSSPKTPQQNKTSASSNNAVKVSEDAKQQPSNNTNTGKTSPSPNGPTTSAKQSTSTPASPAKSSTLSDVKNEANAGGDQTPSTTKASATKQNNAGSPMYELLAHGLDTRLATRLVKLFNSTKLTLADLDDRAVEALKEFGNVEGAIAVLNEFEESNLEHVANKSAFLCGLMKTHRQKEKQNKKEVIATSSTPSASSHGKDSPLAVTRSSTHPGPDEAKLKAILERTGYALDVTSGQRKFGGPPPNWEGQTPEAGCEVYVGKIPKEIFEDELVPLFEKCGRIWDLRLMIDPLNGFSRGFAFITYCTREDALNAQTKVSRLRRKCHLFLMLNFVFYSLRRSMMVMKSGKENR